MVEIKKYFRDRVEDDDEEAVCSVALGAPTDYISSADDSEAQAALEYLKSVRSQSKSLPFALVANIPDSSPTVAPSVSAPSDSVITSPGREALEDAVIEYFVSLKELIARSNVEKQSVMVDFVSDVDETLSIADSASVSTAIEDLSEVRDELETKVVAEWLFGLLVHAELPLLEDTSAALQILRRFCECPPSASGEERHKLDVCSIVIRRYFGQI